MFGWGGGRRRGPRTRREILSACSVLAADAVTVRGELGRSRLEVVSLGATVEVLAAEVGRLRHEMSRVTGELGELRERTSAEADQLVTMLMTQSAQLREELAQSRRSVTELAERMADLLERQQQERAGEPVSTRSVLPPVAPLPAREDAVVTDLREAARPPEERLRLIRHALGG
jgi:chromosome segregation ATPase